MNISSSSTMARKREGVPAHRRNEVDEVKCCYCEAPIELCKFDLTGHPCVQYYCARGQSPHCWFEKNRAWCNKCCVENGYAALDDAAFKEYVFCKHRANRLPTTGPLAIGGPPGLAPPGLPPGSSASEASGSGLASPPPALLATSESSTSTTSQGPNETSQEQEDAASNSISNSNSHNNNGMPELTDMVESLTDMVESLQLQMTQLQLEVRELARRVTQ